VGGSAAERCGMPFMRLKEDSNMSHRSGSVYAAVVFALSVAALGCKAKPGDKCQGSTGKCADGTSALVCVNDVLTAVPCHGTKGCMSTSTTIECDNSLATVGDICLTQGDISCAADHKAALECDNGKFKVAGTCKGADGCQLKPGNRIACDSNVAESGDPCHTNGDYACAMDKKFVLKCDDHKFGEIATCRGPKACRVYELKEENRVEFTCDDTMALENDPCDATGEYACSMDKKSIYTCKSNKYVLAKACPGGCSYDEKDHSLSCMEGGGAKMVLAKTMKEGKGAVATPAAAKTPQGGASAATQPVASVAPQPAASASSGKTADTKPAASAPAAAASTTAAKGAAAPSAKGTAAPPAPKGAAAPAAPAAPAKKK
jgi:hypothetical protein